MARDTFGTNPDDMPYDEYVEQQKQQRQQEQENAKKKNGDSGQSEEGGYEPESYEETGGYDEYVSKESSSGTNSGKSGGGDAEDAAMTGSTSSGSSETLSESGSKLLSTGEGEGGAAGARNATVGETASGVGSRIVEGAKSMGRGAMNGIRGMFTNAMGGIGQVAEKLHVSAKVLTVGMALVGGGSITLFGMTLFGEQNIASSLPLNDCQVKAIVQVDYTDNEVYHPIKQPAMDSNVQTLYKALINFKTIDGVIGKEYVVGVEGSDPYYDQRTILYGRPGDDTIDRSKYIGTDSQGRQMWMYDINMGETMWDHGPATAKDDDTGIYNVLPGNDSAHKVGAGTMPGLSDQRKQQRRGFTDEAVLGLALNAEGESSVNPNCWEAMTACFYYYETVGNEIPTSPTSGGSHPGGKDVVMATTHHRNWNKYVQAMKDWWSACGTTIVISSYHYTDRWGQETDQDGETLYYPGVGLWQWTGPRAYALQEWSNMLMNLSDHTLDTSNDAMWTINTQIYYLLFENHGDFDGNDARHGAKDFGGQLRYIMDSNGDYLKDTAEGGRTSLIDWGIKDRANYEERYFVNIPNRPNDYGENVYDRERISVHKFDTIRTREIDGEEETIIKTNHDNLVRPQFDYIYVDLAETPTGTWHGGAVKDDTSGLLRKIDPAVLEQLYHIMLSHPKRPACKCTTCCSCKHTPHESHTNTSCPHPKPPCSNPCATVTVAGGQHACPDCTPRDCMAFWCYHQCQLDRETNYRKMIEYLMTDWYVDDTDTLWWKGLTEADFLDVGAHNDQKPSGDYACGDILYWNCIENTESHDYKKALLGPDHSLSVYYVKWYYDVSVEVTALAGGTILHDVDNMNGSSGGTGGMQNGVAARPDNTSYKSGPNGRTQAGDQIIYESTPEAVFGFVPAQATFKDNTTSHPGTTLDATGYAAEYHTEWMRGGADSFSESERHIYMQRDHGDTDTRWANYMDSGYEDPSAGFTALDKAPDKHIGWTMELFDQWWDLDDTKVSDFHKQKTEYSANSGYEYIDWYYRMRLGAYDDTVKVGSPYVYGTKFTAESPTGNTIAAWDEEKDGSLAHTGTKTGSDAFYTEYTGTKGRTYPMRPVEPMWADLGKGGSEEGSGITSGNGVGSDPDADPGAAMGTMATTNAKVADVRAAAAARGLYGADDYLFVRILSDDLMWWAESRAIAQVSRIAAREYTINWEGGGDSALPSHSKYGSAVHYAVKMLSNKWKTENSFSKTIMDLWYEDMSNAPLQTWWASFYHNYCGGSVGFGGIADCAVGWAWIRKSSGEETYLPSLDDPSKQLGDGRYMQMRCTELYYESKKILEQVGAGDPIKGLFSSCDRGVCSAVHAAGADEDYPWGAAKGQLDYCIAHPEKWEPLGQVNDGIWESLQPGDLLLSHHHVVVFTGEDAAIEKWPDEVQPGDAPRGIAHSSLTTDINGSRGVRFDKDGSYLNGYGDFYAFRLVGEPDPESSPSHMALVAEEGRLGGLQDGS